MKKEVNENLLDCEWFPSDGVEAIYVFPPPISFHVINEFHNTGLVPQRYNIELR